MVKPIFGHFVMMYCSTFSGIILVTLNNALDYRANGLLTVTLVR